MNTFDVVKACQMACLLEVSSYPKPGNVSRVADFEDLKYEEFLLCGVTLGEAIFGACEAARNGLCQTGGFILEAVRGSKRWSPHNANLGIILLTIPIAQAAATGDFSGLRSRLKAVCEGTTLDDALAVSDAIWIADPSGMGHAEKFDVTTEDGRREIVEGGETLLDLFKISSPWDRISSEWVENFPITFEVGYPSVRRLFFEEVGLNHATRMTFLEILSNYPDTLISRKVGENKAVEVMHMARRVRDEFSEDALFELDRELRKDRNLNPGTTADLTASSLFVFFLERLEKGF